MLVRTAVLQDHAAVVELMQYLHLSDPKLTENISLPIFTEILESKYFTITVAELNSKLVGSCYLNIIPNLTRKAASYAVIENVVTHPEHRLHGIGRNLVLHALDQAKADGCYKVMLLTGGDSGVQQFYKSCGMKSDVKKAFIKRW